MTRYSEMYETKVIAPLTNGELVACFLVRTPLNDEFVLFCSHRLSGRAEKVSTAAEAGVRAALAVSIQREARQKAALVGFNAVIR